MDIVIAGALPHSSIASEAGNFLPKSAPHFLERLQTHQAQAQDIDVESTGCTPLETYQLQAAGLATQAANLGALYLPEALQATVQPGHGIYLMRLGHIALGQNSAILHTADELAITPAQSLALFENAQTIFAHSPYKLLTYHPEYFLVDLGPEFQANLASPNLLATGYLNDWWPQDEQTRPLRALLGELQMSWFNHPVNQERERQGLPVINTAWIFGGVQAKPELLARLPLAAQQTVKNDSLPAANSLMHLISPSTMNVSQSTQTPAKPYYLIDNMQFAHRQQDWGVWLQELANLDQQLPSLIETAQQQDKTSNPSYRLVLCGLDRIVTLSPQSWLKRTLQSKQHWKTWW